MRIGTKGIELIQKYEGFRNNAYLDVKGIPTIGWGNTYYQDNTNVRLGDSITRKQGDEMFLLILKRYEDEVNKYVTSKINQSQFDALVSFTYNCGWGALKSSTLLKKVNKDPCEPSILEEFQKWNKSGGKVYKGLKRRRNEEAYLYFSE
ncbi:lysozyme [Leeuwenhoekiella sp. NPDC079379]|uniref:lysozyme n=1 Tax=Leeuwenhoekiella sp. NPDC079379 TaxID=3364122 RepID=UPI0037CA896C